MERGWRERGSRRRAWHMGSCSNCNTWAAVRGWGGEYHRHEAAGAAWASSQGTSHHALFEGLRSGDSSRNW